MSGTCRTVTSALQSALSNFQAPLAIGGYALTGAVALAPSVRAVAQLACSAASTQPCVQLNAAAGNITLNFTIAPPASLAPAATLVPAVRNTTDLYSLDFCIQQAIAAFGAANGIAVGRIAATEVGLFASARAHGGAAPASRAPRR